MSDFGTKTGKEWRESSFIPLFCILYARRPGALPLLTVTADGYNEPWRQWKRLLKSGTGPALDTAACWLSTEAAVLQWGKPPGTGPPAWGAPFSQQPWHQTGTWLSLTVARLEGWHNPRTYPLLYGGKPRHTMSH